MATIAANATKQQRAPVPTGEVTGGMEPLVVGVGPEMAVGGNAKKCNAKVSGAFGRRKGSGSGLEGGRNAKPSGSAHVPSAHTLINYLFYLMCITALGATVYSNLRQTYVEDKLSSLVSIEDRLSLLEAQVSDVYRRITLRKMDVAAAAASIATGIADEAEEEEETMSDVVRKISHQIAELPRMRRDLSALKISRKDRQAAIQQIGNECMCPPGRCSFEWNSFPAGLIHVNSSIKPARYKYLKLKFQTFQLQ
uniref:Uncharacterized protein n=1 Tax=Anopheles culicifacies TaxID=139723 RepID=A0A182MMD1_9DIPT